MIWVLTDAGEDWLRVCGTTEDDELALEWANSTDSREAIKVPFNGLAKYEYL